MKLLEEIKVSVYQNVYSKKPKEMSFLDVISMCIRPEYASIIQTIRRYHDEGDHEAAQKIKSQLPCFTPAGTFNGAHAIRNFQKPSNIIGLDFDHVADRLQVIRQCAEDPHTIAAIESPTDGVKLFAYVEGIEGRHREGQQLVSRYYNQLLGLESDPACKDESRLCYFSYSPNGYIGSLCQAFVLEEGTVCQSPQKKEKECETAKEVSEEEIKKFISSYIFLKPLTPGRRHSNLLKLACEASRRHYPQTAILRELLAFFEGSDFPISEIKSVLSAGYKIVNSQTENPGDSFGPTPQKDKMTKRHYGPSESSDDADESFWQGEEFRKKTPVFPQTLYNNLPDLLNECIIEEGSDHERDISFLSNLTALSAAEPQTFGIYNHKKYSPHIYSVVISPAGSGKSIAQTGRYLLEEIQEQILSNSEHKKRVFDQEHIQWQAECTKKKKSGEKCLEEPIKPPFKMLLIPATTSYTRMQIQMQDNGAQGSIIFDTEAQTLSTANHLDCGNFDDMLRKAFEHENIDSLYKANGTSPVYIRHPQLALFLTGTPGQVNNLLESSENGLVSRILYYTYREAAYWKEMGDDCLSLEDSFKPLSHRVSKMYAFCLDNPVLFHFNRSQWNRLNEVFSHLLSEVVLEGNDDLQAVVKRYAFLVMRISMIQTRVRQFEARNYSPEIYCNDVDFERSLDLVLCCYEHSRLLLSSMASPDIRPLKNPDKIRNFINELPDTFTTDEAINVGAKSDFSSRKVARLLKTLNGLKIRKVSHGVYTKV